MMKYFVYKIRLDNLNVYLVQTNNFVNQSINIHFKVYSVLLGTFRWLLLFVYLLAVVS